MEDIKEDLKYWKASRKTFRRLKKEIKFHYADGVSFGLQLALDRINEKNNKKLKPGACRHEDLVKYEDCWCCLDCGESLIVGPA